MNVIDSSGWLEYFAQGSNADFFSPAIHDIDSLVVPTVCMYEVFKRMLAMLDEDAALQAIGIMSVGKTAELNQEIAINAAQISSELNIAMADSIILATARVYNAALWTQDADFSNIEGVKYIEKNYE
jgi:predicted nucleic acid-binding protein